MAIDNIYPLAGGPRRHAATQGSPDAGSAATAGSDGAARSGSTDEDVDLSAARRLERLTEAVRDVPVFDSVKVERIKTAIAAGEYPIDATRLAEKFAELESKINQ